MAIRPMALMPNRWDKPTKIVFNNNHFGPNPGIYNLMELNCAVKDGSSISGNTFDKGAAEHNFINLYQIDDNATIDIDNNTFECGAATNPIRIAARDLVVDGVSHAPKGVVINIRNNTFSSTEWDENYGGLLFFQPYDSLTSDFSGITINFSNNTNNSNVDKLFYFYLDNRPNSTNTGYRDTQYITNPTDTSKLPTIYVDGHQLTDEELLAHVVAYDYVTTRTEVSLDEYFGAEEIPEPVEGNTGE